MQSDTTYPLSEHGHNAGSSNMTLGQWSLPGTQLIKDIKRSILKKKIMMSFVINSNAWYDKLFRYSHLILGAASIIAGSVNESLGSSSPVATILTSIVFVMIKMRDYLTFDKIKDIAKRQTVKYEQLFQRIDREILKPDSRRQSEDEFLMQINREFNSIEIEDPDIPRVLKEKYIALCKANGIQYDEDLEALQELMKEKLELSHNAQPSPHNAQPSPHNAQPSPHNAQPKTDVHINIANHIEQPPQRSSLSILRARTASDEADRATFKEKIKTIDTRQDLQWALERLETLNDS